MALCHRRHHGRGRFRGVSRRPRLLFGLDCTGKQYLASDHASNVTGQVVRLEGNILSLVSHPEPVHPVILQEGWTVDSLRQFFNRTLGRKLQPVGLLVPTYRYGEGLDKAPPQ